MTTAQWVQLIATIVGVAVAYGALSQRVTHLLAQVSELKAELKLSQRDQGQRIGKLETQVEIFRALSGRRPTLALPAAPPENDGDPP